jgi:hypothetical protein
VANAEARAYRDAVAAKEQVRTEACYMAMIPALDRKIPVVVSANGTSQINDAITWAKQESGSLYTDRLPYEAGVAVAFGLPEEEAIEAVTINATEFMGLSDRLGSLEVGKQATLLMTTGTPIDTRSDVLQAYIQGKEIDMIDIQKPSFLKYMEKVRQKMKIIS